jgi:hypothetical protein
MALYNTERAITGMPTCDGFSWDFSASNSAGKEWDIALPFKYGHQ